LKFYQERVFYLPGKTPESLIWNESHSGHLLDGDQSRVSKIAGFESVKENLHYLSDEGFSSKVFIRKWIQSNDDNLKNLIATLHGILDS